MGAGRPKLKVVLEWRGQVMADVGFGAMPPLAVATPVLPASPGSMPAVEPRLQVAVLHVAGLVFDGPLPEADPFNFPPRPEAASEKRLTVWPVRWSGSGRT